MTEAPEGLFLSQLATATVPMSARPLETYKLRTGPMLPLWIEGVVVRVEMEQPRPTGRFRPSGH